MGAGVAYSFSTTAGPGVHVLEPAASAHVLEHLPGGGKRLRPLAQRQARIPPHLLLALGPLPHRQTLLEHIEGEPRFKAWAQRPVHPVAPQKRLGQRGVGASRYPAIGRTRSVSGSLKPGYMSKTPLTRHCPPVSSTTTFDSW